MEKNRNFTPQKLYFGWISRRNKFLEKIRRLTKDNKRNFVLLPAAILLAGVFVSSGIVYKNYTAKESLKNIEISDENQAPLIGSFAPTFTLKTSLGSKINLKDLRGKNVLLVFWSTQCDYSEGELEDLKKFTETYRGRINILAVSYMETPHTVSVYEKNKQINFPIVIDADGSVFSKYGVDGTPFHFLIDKTGKIAAIWPNAADSFGLQTMLKNLSE